MFKLLSSQDTGLSIEWVNKIKAVSSENLYSNRTSTYESKHVEEHLPNGAIISSARIWKPVETLLLCTLLPLRNELSGVLPCHFSEVFQKPFHVHLHLQEREIKSL